jgi:phage gpG-like protein
MSDEDTSFNLTGLDNVLKSIKVSKKNVRVGILGDKNARTEAEGGSLTNAEVGATHEFGTSTLPVRSFLMMPITGYLKNEIANSDIMGPENIRYLVKNSDPEKILEQIGYVAEGLVLKAFETGGFGRWKESNMKYKEVKQTLVETQQLRNSITSEVV